MSGLSVTTGSPGIFMCFGKCMKKLIYIVSLLFLLLGCNESSSPSDNSSSDFEEETAGQYGTILFFNESSYNISVHSDAFSGPVLAELTSGEAKAVSVRASNNYGIGSVFAIGFRTKVIDDFNLACGEIYAYGIDPNMQLAVNVEAGKKYTLQIPQPSELVYETAFIQILNVSSNSFELTKNSMSYKQAGNGVLPVGVGEIGVYEIPASAKGTAFEGFKLKSVFKDYDIPSFEAVYSHVYSFSFDGSSVAKTGERNLVID